MGIEHPVWATPSQRRRIGERFVKKFRVRTLDPSGAKLEELSGGNQQKVVLAKALTRRPRIAIIDEPTRGVDVGVIDEIHSQIRELADYGVAVIVISSYLPEILALSDRVLVARQGHIVAEFSSEEVNEESIMFAAVHCRDGQSVRHRSVALVAEYTCCSDRRCWDGRLHGGDRYGRGRGRVRNLSTSDV